MLNFWVNVFATSLPAKAEVLNRCTAEPIGAVKSSRGAANF